VARDIAPDAQEAIATARFIRMSPSKVRRVVDLIRGRHVDDARRVLRFTERDAAEVIAKVLDSAIANAENNRGLPADELHVARAWVDEGPTLKRFRPRAMGRATRIRKRTCHVSVVVGRDEDVIQSLLETTATEPSPQKGSTETGKKSTAKKSTAKKTTAKKSSAKRSTAKKTTAKKTTAKKTGRKSDAAGESSAKQEPSTNAEEEAD